MPAGRRNAPGRWIWDQFLDAYGLRGCLPQLCQYLVHVEGGRLLALRIIPERRQELGNIILRRNKQEGVIKKPIVVGV